MYEVLLSHWDTIQKMILNTVLISIPEELYLLMFTLIMMGEFDYWKEAECKKLINSWDYPRILIPTIPVALLSNILRYSGMDFPMFFFLPIIVFYVLIVLTNDVLKDANALEWMGRALVFLVIAIITLGMAEFACIPLVVYGMGRSLEEVNNDILLNFLISLPVKVIQASILLYLISRKRTLLRGNIIKYISRNPFLTVLTVITVILDMVFLFSAYNAVVYEKMLMNISYMMQVAIITGVIIFPVLNITALIGGIYYVKNKETHHKKNAYEQLDDLLQKIKIYTNHENYDNMNSIRWKLNEIEQEIGQVAKILYEEI